LDTNIDFLLRKCLLRLPAQKEEASAQNGLLRRTSCVSSIHKSNYTQKKKICKQFLVFFDLSVIPAKLVRRRRIYPQVPSGRHGWEQKSTSPFTSYRRLVGGVFSPTFHVGLQTRGLLYLYCPLQIIRQGLN
jgi:hypothetical protein